MGLGPRLISLEATLWVHLAAAPLAFFSLAFLHQRLARYPRPLPLALVFVGVALALDVGLVAPVFLRSLDMFRSVLGAWAPLVLIFIGSGIGARLGERR